MIRLVTALSLICGLAACAVEPPVEPELAKSLRVQNVTVEAAGVSTIPQLLSARLGISEMQVEADIERALRRELVETSRAGTRPVIVDFRILSIELHSAMVGWDRAFPYSQVVSVMQIRDARTGEILVEGQRVSGNDNLGKHTLRSSSNALFSNGKSNRQAYNDVVNGFAADIRQAIFEFDGLMSLVD